MKFQTTLAVLGLVGASVVGAAPIEANAEYKKIIGKRQFYPVFVKVTSEVAALMLT